MVFKGQDAWRKHPLLTGCAKQPFPHWRLAVGIFTSYVIIEQAWLAVTAPPPSAYKSMMKYKDTGDHDSMPEGTNLRKH